MTSNDATIPGQAVPVDRMPGHWVLARLGKRVLRPGGRELTDRLLGFSTFGPSDDVVELAPGLGSTTELVLARIHRPTSGWIASSLGGDAAVAHVVAGPGRSVIQASAADTGLDDDSADVVFGEAYLTMQPDDRKAEIIEGSARVVRPGGRLGLHEVALVPDNLDPATRNAVRGDLTGTIKVNVSPVTTAEWIELLEGAGFEVRDRFTAHCCTSWQPRRLLADEGVRGTARFVGNVLRQPAARKRVLAMRSAMGRNACHLQACVLVAAACRQD